MSHAQITDDIATTIVLIDYRSKTAHTCYPDPLRVQAGSRLRWHCNPPVGENTKGGPIDVQFDEGAPFTPSQVSGVIGGPTDVMTVTAEAKPGAYTYHVTVAGTSFDPEIIIEEATRARSAGTSV